MLTVEKDIENYLIKKVEAAGGMCLKFPTIHTEGIPDRIVLLPEGKVAFVELKRPEGGRLSEVQKYQINKLRKLGIEVYVLRDKQGVDWFIRKNVKSFAKHCPMDETLCVFFDDNKGCQLPDPSWICRKEVINGEEESKSK